MILVSGYHGYGNLGDEAILACLLRQLTQLGVSRRDICVLSGNPSETEASHNVSTLPRYNLSAIISSLGKAKLVISGGGSLFQDVTSKRTIPYYLGIMEAAFARRVPVVVYAQGLGPVSTRLYQNWIASAFRRLAGFSLRDQNSAHLLRNWGVTVRDNQITADPVFLWSNVLESASSGRRDGPILLNLRPTSRTLVPWIKALQFLSRDEIERLKFVSLGPGDYEIGQSLGREFPQLTVLPPASLEHTMEYFRSATYCFSMRLHGLILGAVSRCYPVALSYDPKVDEVSRLLDIPCYHWENATNWSEVLRESEQQFFTNSRKIQGKVETLHRQAELNLNLLADVLGKAESI